MIRKALSFAAFTSAVFAGIVMFAAPACTTHQCDASTIAIGADTGGAGFWLPSDCSGGCSQVTWHSSDTMNSPWTNFPGNATLVFTFPPFPLLPPGFVPDFDAATLPAPLLAVAPPIGDDEFNLTTAAGQLDEFTSWSSSSITVKNASCNEGYSVLVMLQVPIVPAADAGASPEGGAQDGGDAGVDADSSTSE